MTAQMMPLTQALPLTRTLTILKNMIIFPWSTMEPFQASAFRPGWLIAFLGFPGASFRITGNISWTAGIWTANFVPSICCSGFTARYRCNRIEPVHFYGRVSVYREWRFNRQYRCLGNYRCCRIWCRTIFVMCMTKKRLFYTRPYTGQWF